jgi:hypothetical protein
MDFMLIRSGNWLVVYQFTTTTPFIYFFLELLLSFSVGGYIGKDQRIIRHVFVYIYNDLITKLQQPLHD